MTFTEEDYVYERLAGTIKIKYMQDVVSDIQGNLSRGPVYAQHVETFEEWKTRKKQEHALFLFNCARNS